MIIVKEEISIKICNLLIKKSIIEKNIGKRNLIF